MTLIAGAKPAMALSFKKAFGIGVGVAFISGGDIGSGNYDFSQIID